MICGDAISDYTHHGLKRDVKLSTVIGSCDPRAKSHDQSHDHIWIQSWLDTLKKVSGAKTIGKVYTFSIPAVFSEGDSCAGDYLLRSLPSLPC